MSLVVFLYTRDQTDDLYNEINDLTGLTTIIHRIHSYAILQNWSGLGHHLSCVDLEKLRTIFIVGYCRYSCPLKSKTPEWPKLVQRSLIELNRRGENGKQLLKGLI